VLELRALQARQAQASDAMAALYLQLVPDASRVVDAEAQLALALDRLRGGAGSSGALPMLARIAPVLGDARYSLDLIEYRDGGLELLVRGPDVAALDALREALSTQLGVAVELTSAVPGQGGVEARYRVRGAGA
jgi:type II secretory pathway component PulL